MESLKLTVTIHDSDREVALASALFDVVTAFRDQGTTTRAMERRATQWLANRCADDEKAEGAREG